MCGITGWIDWRRDLRNEKKQITKMTHTLNRRGPDALATWEDKNVAFGHARLIVVDPEGGVQPMTKKVNGKTYTIVYNGELYNTEDIRKQLIAYDHSFTGHSDTEVLLKAYIQWKEKCLEKLNGIFAFAIWSHSEQRLMMARDRVGVKPLFYTIKDGFLLFGSEIKSLLAHRDVEPILDRNGLADVMGLAPSRTPGQGIFKGINELKPAHFLTFSERETTVKRYWQLHSEVHNHSVKETSSYLRELLEDIVERQLFADVPVGMFLSGGIDSSALTAIAANYYKKTGKGSISSYSIDYEENDKYFKASAFQPNADAEWVKKVSAHCQTKHKDCVIDNAELSELLKEAVLVRDTPGMADVDSSLLWFCKQIKQDVTVGLSGECADEIFGGYPWFHKPEVMNYDGFPWMRSINERDDLLAPVWQKRLDLKSYVYERYKDTIYETPRFDGDTDEEARRREISYLNMTWFMTNLLDRKDRMSMGASLEVRVPFSDHRLIEYVWNIPWEMKIYGGREKGILRKALEGILPDDVLYRKKSPYPKTHHPVYTEAVTAGVQKMLNEKNSPLFEVIEQKKLKQLLDKGGFDTGNPYFGHPM